MKRIKDLIVELTNDENVVIVAGDLNVKTKLIDSAEAYENRLDSDFVASWYSAPDKALFNSILDNNLTDCFRYLYPNKSNCYTCWNSGLKARVNNYGTRIDYILLSKSSEPFIKSSKILSDIMGSDHCPILTEIDFNDILQSDVVPPECTIFYPELKGKQAVLSDMMLLNNKRKSDHLISKSPHKQFMQGDDCSKRQRLARPKYCKKKTQSKLTLFPVLSNKMLSEEHVQKQAACIKSKNMPHETVSLNKHEGVSVKSLLIGLPKPPLCSGHQTRATLKTVLKDGANKGKRFYCCSLPIGPSSSKTSRCNFFKWFDE